MIYLGIIFNISLLRTDVRIVGTALALFKDDVILSILENNKVLNMF